MRPRTVILLLVPLAFVACAAGPYADGPQASPPWDPDTRTEIRFFYSDLAPYGDWVLVEAHGWVWIPWDVPVGWRPYSHGRWVYTPDGWTWVSDWAWGWAPFHYGRWTWHHRYGWVWIPDGVWAPAWVAWRSGPGWIGWAPLPPGVSWRVGIGLDFGSVDLTLAVGSHWWVFVDERDFVDPHPWRRAYPMPRNAWLLRQTRDVTRYEDVDRRVVVRSLPPRDLERTLGRAVPRYEVEELRAPSGRWTEAIERERVKIYRPDPEIPGEAARTRPAETAPPPAERAYEKDRKELERWERTQEDRLEELHRKEIRRVPEDSSAAEVRKRQAAETRALREQVERQRQVLDERRELRESRTETKREAIEKQKAEEKPKAKRRKPPE
jgi:hypothetical protein